MFKICTQQLCNLFDGNGNCYEILRSPYFIWHNHFSTPAANSLRLWTVRRVGYIVTISEPTGSESRAYSVNK